VTEILHDHALEYQHASDDLERFLGDLRERSDLATRNQTYTRSDLHDGARCLSGVSPSSRGEGEAILFADELPPILRATFIADRNIAKP
jgi:uncharacterized protein (DUF2267 family)